MLLIFAAAVLESCSADQGCKLFSNLSLFFLFPFFPFPFSPGYGILKLDVKTKSQSGVVSTPVVSVSLVCLGLFSALCSVDQMADAHVTVCLLSDLNNIHSLAQSSTACSLVLALIPRQHVVS